MGDRPRETAVLQALYDLGASRRGGWRLRFIGAFAIICGVGGNIMATSSITANFVMRDPKVSRAFVRALLARRPSDNVPRIRNDWEVLSDPESIRGFFGRRPAKKALHA